jgi:hypothetical protein
VEKTTKDTMSGGATFMIIGGPGAGKTPFVRNFIADSYCCVFDVQNEYGERTKYPGQTPVRLTDNTKEPRSRYVGGDVEQFISICNLKRNTVCVFEEATAFFEGRTGKSMRRLMINRYHTGNVYLLLFHSINSVPPRLMELSGNVVLFRTNDEEHNIERKFPRLLQYYKRLQTAQPGEKFIIKV